MPLHRGCSKATERENFRKLYAENARLPPGRRRSRAQITAIVLSEARRTGKGRQCRPGPNPNRASGRMRPTPAAVGRHYAQDQLSGDHFQNWMLDQLSATGPDMMDQPNPSNARRIAHNMLVQVKYDTSRELTDRDAVRLLDAVNARSDATALREFGTGLRAGFDKSLSWLADEVLLRLQEKAAHGKKKHRAEGHASHGWMAVRLDHAIIGSGPAIVVARPRSVREYYDMFTRSERGLQGRMRLWKGSYPVGTRLSSTLKPGTGEGIHRVID